MVKAAVGAIRRCVEASTQSLSAKGNWQLATGNWQLATGSLDNKHIHHLRHRNTHHDSGNDLHSRVAHAFTQYGQVSSAGRKLVDRGGMLAHLPAQTIRIHDDDKSER